MKTETYDKIGRGYTSSRRTDGRIERALHDALGSSRSILNVGAGTGSYEPSDRDVVAVDISHVMLAQRSIERAKAIRASVELLPFDGASFDAVLGVLTMHHWRNQRAGLAECRRVARERIVFLTWDPASPAFWLEHYFPDLLSYDRRVFPSMNLLGDVMGDIEVRVIPIPFDCVDGFLGAFWRRPEAYLDAAIRAGMSSFSRISDVDAGVRALRHDLETGEWHSRHEHLLQSDELDVGYRIVIGTHRY